MKLLRYLFFLRGATNQHGVHSPFVYALVTQCLYNTSLFKTWCATQSITQVKYYKPYRYVIALLAYFKPKTVLVVGNASEVNTHIFKTYNLEVHYLDNMPLPNRTFDMLYIDTLNTLTAKQILTLISTMHNNTVCYIKAQPTKTKYLQHWQRLQQHPKTTVTVNCFMFGLVFIRKEQNKQHFKIRL